MWEIEQGDGLDTVVGGEDVRDNEGHTEHELEVLAGGGGETSCKTSL